MRAAAERAEDEQRGEGVRCQGRCYWRSSEAIRATRRGRGYEAVAGGRANGMRPRGG